MSPRMLPLVGMVVWGLALSSCVSTARTQRASVLEFLYPAGSESVPPADVRLELPVRVGLAFAPASTYQHATLSEGQRQALLERVADAFRGQEGIAGIDVVPSHHLESKGGFANLDRLRGMYGFDLMALVSYEQSQFDDANRASLTYWTVVGAYFVPGDDTDTHTFVDTAVLDVPSRALLFSAVGQSRIQETSTLVDVSSDLRERSVLGFEQAFEAMVAQLEVRLAAFREQARTGTVRGAGTPAIEVVRGDGAGGGTGVGALGVVEAGAAALLALSVLAGAAASRSA